MGAVRQRTSAAMMTSRAFEIFMNPDILILVGKRLARGSSL